MSEFVDYHFAKLTSSSTRFLQCIIIFYGILYWVDDLPFQLVGVGILAHLI